MRSRFVPAMALLCFWGSFLAPAPSHGVTPTFSNPRQFGTKHDYTTSVVAGDLDGDGDLDLVVGNGGISPYLGSQNAAYLNDGAGNFIDVRLFGARSDVTQGVALGDVDNDGDLDIAVANSDPMGPFRGRQDAVYFNDGEGNFPISINIGTADDESTAVAMGDVDRDGDLDIAVLLRSPGIDTLYINDGSGNFSETRLFGSAYSNEGGLALGDVDGDDDLDIVVAMQGRQHIVYLNDGAGDFSESRDFGTDADSPTSVLLGDMDGDGDLDCVLGSLLQQNIVYLNDGAGNFVEVRPFGDPTERTQACAAGDVDGDGDLDIAVGNGSSQSALYLNDGSGNFAETAAIDDLVHPILSLCLMDADGDGDLDVALGIQERANAVFFNDGPGGFFASSAYGPASGVTSALALGDMDGDGDLDIAAGNAVWPSIVYFNDGYGEFPTSEDITPGWHNTYDLVTGDLDGDGDLDLVQIFLQQPSDQGQLVHLNDGTGSFPETRTFGTALETFFSVALGDLDRDGDLDIVATRNGQNKVFLNDGNGNLDDSRPFGPGDDYSVSVALGDLDGDGDLDAAVGNNYFNQSAVFLNDGSGSFPESRTFGMGERMLAHLALGDLDGDGDLDIAAGYDGEPTTVYSNDGSGSFSEGRELGAGFEKVRALALGDIEGDGDLDIVLGNQYQPDFAYLNDGTGQFTASTELGPSPEATTALALGDLNGDGTLDIVVGATIGVVKLVYWNSRPGKPLLPDNPPYVALSRPGATRDAGFYSTPEILGDQLIPLSYKLFDGEADKVLAIVATYSPNGGGFWLPAIGSVDTAVADLETSAAGIEYTFTWDTFASGFFGQSDNVVFRIEAYPDLRPRMDAVCGPYQHGFNAATTFPFRVRGTQVRVVQDAVGKEDAMVYRITQGRTGELFTDGAGVPYRTDADGYLRGRGQLALGDELVALLPVADMGKYTLYYTSAAPTSSGLDTQEVTQAGVQTLSVSASNPLILFDLSVSLQWDARYDAQYLAQLEYDLGRASAALYDWTNGQVALGNISVYQDREKWTEADILIHASNRLRPSAEQGGIVGIGGEKPDPDNPDYIYEPGQVHIGPVWNRYGEPGAGLGEDWPRTLAHELGHYLLYLDDNYLGYDAAGLVVPVEGCSGAMSDPYQEGFPYDEFHDAATWLPVCANTLSDWNTGRSDWETIATFYPDLIGTTVNEGPASLPLAVTQVEFVEPPWTSSALADPTFYLTLNGEPVLPGYTARAFLFDGPWISDLGRPTLDRVVARGAAEGDRLCVFELERERLGCEQIGPLDYELELTEKVGWQPQVRVSPTDSKNIGITVSNAPAGLTLWARLWLFNAPAPDAVELTETVDGYEGTVTTTVDALAGYVQVWVDETAPRREVITDYALGGNPGRRLSLTGSPGRGRQAPAISADGQVLLFGDLDFAEGEFFTLQAATLLPSTPSWTTLVGEGYHLIATPGVPDLTGSSISFSYLGSEIPPGEEEWLHVYYQAPGSTTWQLLSTSLDLAHNAASAPAQGVGLYALMSSVEIPLYAGWNNFSYHAKQTRPVAEALASIEGYYTTVYGYDPLDTLDPWKVYDVNAPEYVNDLTDLEFGHGYWINVTEAVTLYLRGLGLGEGQPAGLPALPSTYYGPLLEAPSFTPVAGMTLVASVEGSPCGQMTTLDVGGQIVYVIDVFSNGEVQGCGETGKRIAFEVDDHPMTPTGPWLGGQPQELPLSALERRFLPFIARN